MIKFYLKKIYQLIPNRIKIIFFLIFKKIFNPEEKIFQHLHFKGFFKINFNNKTAYMYSIGTILENTIFWKNIENAHEPLSLQIWYFLSKESKYIFDIGANIGLYSLIAHIANKNSEIHAFEPSDKFITALNNIKKKNNINLKINLSALGDNEKTIYYDGYRTTSDIREMKYYSRTINSKWQKIKQIRLSEYILVKKIKKIDLIKLDIEKYEYKVLKDIKNYIKKFQPNMLVEIINGDEESKNNIKNVIGQIIKELKYKIYLIDDKNKIINQSSSIEYSTYWNVLFLNSETTKLFEKNFNVIKSLS